MSLELLESKRWRDAASMEAYSLMEDLAELNGLQQGIHQVKDPSLEQRDAVRRFDEIAERLDENPLTLDVLMMLGRHIEEIKERIIKIRIDVGNLTADVEGYRFRRDSNHEETQSTFEDLASRARAIMYQLDDTSELFPPKRRDSQRKY